MKDSGEKDYILAPTVTFKSRLTLDEAARRFSDDCYTDEESLEARETTSAKTVDYKY